MHLIMTILCSTNVLLSTLVLDNLCDSIYRYVGLRCNYLFLKSHGRWNVTFIIGCLCLFFSGINVWSFVCLLS